MKTKKMLALILTCILGAASLLSGCGKEGKTDVSDTMDKEQYVNYTFITDLKTADPSLNDNTYGGMILTDTLEPLTRAIVKPDGTESIEPAGAESWDISEDGKTYTFHLRDFTWDDGQKVTAQQYAYSLLRTLDPNTGSSYSYLLAAIKGATAYNGKKGSKEDVGIKAPDDKTLVIELGVPAPYFLQLTYFTIFVPQREDIIAKYGETYGAEANTILSCGPFKMTEWIHDSKIVLTKNQAYWDKDKVKLDTVNIKVIKEEDARYQELYTGGLDMCENVTVPEWKDKFNALGTLDFYEKIQPGTVYMLFNQTTTINGVKFFSNEKIRKAFLTAIDRKQACDLVYDNTETPATGWVPPKVLIGEDDFRKAAGFDPVTKLVEEVKDPKALLIEGLTELGADPDPSKYTVTYLVGNTSARGKKNAEVYQQMLQNALGVTMNIEQVESGVRTDRIQNLQYDFIIAGWLGDFNDPATFLDMFRTTAPVYPSGYTNTAYDAALDKANSTQDSAVRLEAFKEAEKLLIYEDAVLAPIGFDIQSEYQYKYVKNVMRPMFGSIAELKYAYVQGRK